MLVYTRRDLIRYGSYRRKEHQQDKEERGQEDKWQVQGVHLSTYWFPCMGGCLSGRKSRRAKNGVSVSHIPCWRRKAEKEDLRTAEG